jgi:hypothetical protein
MAQDGAYSAGHHRGNPTRLTCALHVADGEHALVDALKPALRNAPRYRASANPNSGQLPMGDNTVLASRQSRKPPIRVWVV